MIQELLALLVIFFFLVRLGIQLQRDQIKRSQFIFWLIFWLVAGIVILYLQEIDRFVARLGFSSSGIEVLLYVAVAVIFYWLLRLRLKFEQLEKNITTLTRLLSRTTPADKSKHDSSSSLT